MKQLKVLFASNNALIGGAQNILADLMVSLREQEIRPTAVYPAEGPQTRRVRETGVDVRILPMVWWTCLGKRGKQPEIVEFAAGLRDRTESLAKFIEAESIDVVFTNTSVVIEPALAACLTRRPHVWQVLELLSMNEELCAVEDRAFLHALMNVPGTQVVAVSKAVKRDLASGVEDAHLSVVHTGIDLGRYPSRLARGALPAGMADDPPDTKRLLFVGTLSRCKGVQDLAPALNRVFAARADTVLYLAGREGGVSYKSLANGLHRQYRNRCRYLGRRSDVLELLRAADLFVLPSHADSFPVTVLEAMAAGLPVVGTRSGGMSEQIVDGVTGQLCPVGSPGNLADAILDVLSDPGRAKAMGEAGRRRIETEFNRDRMVAEFAKKLRGAAESSPRPSETTREMARGMLSLQHTFGLQMKAAWESRGLRRYVPKRLRAAYRGIKRALRHRRD